MSRFAKHVCGGLAVLAFYAGAMWVAGCALLPNEQSRHAQGEAARVAGEVACTRHIKRLVELRDQGKTCEEAKAQAASENPLCNLSFTCKFRDGGTEGDAQ